MNMFWGGGEERASPLNLLNGIWLFYHFMFLIHSREKSVIVTNLNGRGKEINNFTPIAIYNM